MEVRFRPIVEPIPFFTKKRNLLASMYLADFVLIHAVC